MSVTKELEAENDELPRPDRSGIRRSGVPVTDPVRKTKFDVVLPREDPAETDISAVNAAEDEKNEESEEKIPALFGDVCLDKYKKHEEPEHIPTLLEFLNQPPDDPPLPVPSLFEGIGREYFASEEVLRLAAEADAAENIKKKAEKDADGEGGGEDGEDGNLYSVDDAVKDVEEPPPDANELFGMISSIYQQQREDWDRHEYENRMTVRRKSDPYNTLFNNRQPVINYDNIDELPMGEKYTLTVVESRQKPGRAKERPRQPGGRRHFKI